MVNNSAALLPPVQELLDLFPGVAFLPDRAGQQKRLELPEGLEPAKARPRYPEGRLHFKRPHRFG
jgi:hypothetical protein